MHKNIQKKVGVKLFGVIYGTFLYIGCDGMKEGEICHVGKKGNKIWLGDDFILRQNTCCINISRRKLKKINWSHC